MDNWEYKTIKFHSGGLFGGKIDEIEVEEVLNQYGGSGWELVTCFDTSYSQGGSREIVAIMKRKF